MDTVQLFCDALHTTPKLEEEASTAKIHKAEKQHLKYITELFDQLPYRVPQVLPNFCGPCQPGQAFRSSCPSPLAASQPTRGSRPRFAAAVYLLCL